MDRSKRMLEAQQRQERGDTASREGARGGANQDNGMHDFHALLKEQIAAEDARLRNSEGQTTGVLPFGKKRGRSSGTSGGRKSGSLSDLYTEGERQQRREDCGQSEHGSRTDCDRPDGSRSVSPPVLTAQGGRDSGLSGTAATTSQSSHHHTGHRPAHSSPTLGRPPLPSSPGDAARSVMTANPITVYDEESQPASPAGGDAGATDSHQEHHVPHWSTNSSRNASTPRLQFAVSPATLPKHPPNWHAQRSVGSQETSRATPQSPPHTHTDSPQAFPALPPSSGGDHLVSVGDDGEYEDVPLPNRATPNAEAESAANDFFAAAHTAPLEEEALHVAPAVSKIPPAGTPQREWLTPNTRATPNTGFPPLPPSVTVTAPASAGELSRKHAAVYGCMGKDFSGFRNAGNDCYACSVLSLLFKNRTFREYLFSSPLYLCVPVGAALRRFERMRPRTEGALVHNDDNIRGDPPAEASTTLDQERYDFVAATVRQRHVCFEAHDDTELLQTEGVAAAVKALLPVLCTLNQTELAELPLVYEDCYVDPTLGTGAQDGAVGGASAEADNGAEWAPRGTLHYLLRKLTMFMRRREYLFTTFSAVPPLADDDDDAVPLEVFLTALRHVDTPEDVDVYSNHLRQRRVTFTKQLRRALAEEQEMVAHSKLADAIHNDAVKTDLLLALYRQGIPLHSLASFFTMGEKTYRPLPPPAAKGGAVHQDEPGMRSSAGGGGGADLSQVGGSVDDGAVDAASDCGADAEEEGNVTLGDQDISFFCGEQEDAHEFFVTLVAKLSTEMTFFNRNLASLLQRKDLPRSAVPRVNPLDDLLQGELLNIVRCRGCAHEIITRDSFVNISLSFPEPSKEPVAERATGGSVIATVSDSAQAEGKVCASVNAGNKEVMTAEAPCALPPSALAHSLTTISSSSSSSTVPEATAAAVRAAETLEDDNDLLVGDIVGAPREADKTSGGSPPTATSVVTEKGEEEALRLSTLLRQNIQQYSKLYDYRCDKCHEKNTTAQGCCFFNAPPQLLTFQLKRFQTRFENGMPVFDKNSSAVALERTLVLHSIVNKLPENYQRSGAPCGPYYSEKTKTFTAPLHAAEGWPGEGEALFNAGRTDAATQITALRSTYRLYGFVRHLGSDLYAGHYVTDFRMPEPPGAGTKNNSKYSSTHDLWRTVNDSHVKLDATEYSSGSDEEHGENDWEEDERYVRSTQCYLVMYECTRREFVQCHVHDVLPEFRGSVS